MAQKRPPLTPEQRSQVNSRNGQQGKGKKSEAGKRKSSRNSLKHGFTGEGKVLIDHDLAELDVMLPIWNNDLNPEGAAERFLVRRMATIGCRLDRAAKQETAVLALKAREAIGAYDREVQNKVQQLGIRLLDDPIPHSGPYLPDYDYPPAVKWRLDEPIIMVMEMKETVQGCDYLLDRWRELNYMLAKDGYWHYDSKFKAIRMMGKRPETVLDDVLIGDIFLCNQRLHPEGMAKWLLACQLSAYLIENRPIYHVRVTKLAERLPSEDIEARNFLHGIVAKEIAALETLREELIPLYHRNREEAPLRSAFDDSKQGELRRRYETANERDLHRCLADYIKLKKAEIGGNEAKSSAGKSTESNSGQKDTSSANGPAGASRNEAKCGAPAAPEWPDFESPKAPEGSNRGESPPPMAV